MELVFHDFLFHWSKNSKVAQGKDHIKESISEMRYKPYYK